MNSNKENLYQFVKKNRISKAAFLSFFILAALNLYFLCVAFFGERGLKKFFVLKQQNYDLEVQKSEINYILDNKKRMVESMSIDSLDLDLVDEQSRQVLGYVGKNEKVIFKK